MAQEPPQQPRRRRPRYAGTHPRRFDQKYKELDPQAYPGFHKHVRSRGDTPAGTHVPILIQEVMEVLRPAKGEIVADCTLGNGGHAMAFIERIGPTGRLVGFDVDASQLERARERLGGRGETLNTDRQDAGPTLASGGTRKRVLPDAAVSLRRGNFAGIGNALAAESLDGYDIVFADLGVSSIQIDDPARGFSYKHDGPLDMRMDDRLKRTAADLLGRLSVEELSAALFELGDEPDHEPIARQIVERRQRRPLTRTGELVQLILEAKGLSARNWREQVAGSRRATRATLRGAHPENARAHRLETGATEAKHRLGAGATGGSGRTLKHSQRLLHPAARTFQALRILVNDELGSLRQLLRVAPYCLRPGGRIGIITFHSGEDRLVAAAFAEGLSAGVYSEAPAEPIRPGPQERHDNPRSSPARLRHAIRGRA